jgi:hypothetical protein
MANSSGPTANGGYGSQSSIGGSNGGSDDVIRIDPGAIDASATENGGSNPKPGYGPNGRKLNRDGSERAQRGSAGRASPRAAAPQAPLSVDALAFSITGIHALLSATLQIPELALDKSEGDALAKALANLQRFYNIQVTEKALAWSNLAMTLATVYGTRLGAIAARKAADKRPKPAGATILRPDFQRPPQPSVMTPAPSMSPDGDPTSAPPIDGGAKPTTVGDNIFASTPADLI